MSWIVNIIDRTLRVILAVLFSGLVVVVAFQVIARNLLAVSAPWSLELAQLLFSWCIFLGAGLAFRYGQHYTVNLWPNESPLNVLPEIAQFVASAIVFFVLVWHGIIMSQIGMDRLSLALGISEFWFYLPIPISGVLMAIFLFDRCVNGGID